MSRLSDLTQRIVQPQSARHVAVAGCATIIAVQAARLGWVFLTPLGAMGEPAAPPPPPASVDLAALDRFDPFFRTVSMGAADASASSPMRLFGVRTGALASAIIAGADGRQTAVAVGDEVSPGVVLKAVAADHVLLTVNGRPSKLAFPPPGSVPAAAYAPPPSPAAPPTPAIAAAPPAQASGVSFPLSSADPALLAQAGLQPGDTVISVDGARPGEATVQFERAGEVRTATLKAPQS